MSKTFPINDIYPLINHGHKDYGENKVQEAVEKWTDVKNNFKNIKLHLIGKLQTNKVKYAIPLDNTKLAEKISAEQIKKKFKPKIFIQVNIGNEIQKNGIEPENLNKFIDNCINNLDLDIIGLMCIPPLNGDINNFFLEMSKLKERINLKELSMGMSNDYLDAIDYNSTFVRIGSKIFGNRT